MYDLNGLLIGEYDNTGALVKEYVYLNGAPLAMIEAGSPEVLTYLHVNHLGTPIFGTNTGGTQVWAWAPDVFGNGAPTGSRTVNLRMPGQYYDSESSLFYNWNRYYNPATGRYISSDPIGIEGGLNTFNYVDASPVMYMDFLGLDGSILQALFPAHTAYFSSRPIGGSVQTQIEYANRVNAFRSFEANMASIATAFGAPELGAGARSMEGLACKAGDNGIAVQFGRVENQTSHAFRHTDAAGFDRGIVQEMIEADLSRKARLLPKGQYNGTVIVNGTELSYSAYKLPNGIINVGRITPPR